MRHGTDAEWNAFLFTTHYTDLYGMPLTCILHTRKKHEFSKSIHRDNDMGQIYFVSQKDFHGRCTKDGCPFFHAHVTWSPVSPLSLSAQQVQRKHQAQLAVGDPVVISDPKYVSDGLTTGRFVAVDFGASEPLLKVDFGDHCGYLHPQFVRKAWFTKSELHCFTSC